MFFFPEGERGIGIVRGVCVSQYLRGEIVRWSTETFVRRSGVGQQSSGDISRRANHVSASVLL